MVSLDQVLLLEEKVESAVAKISQLKAENDALRAQCAELKNSLAAKSEQISSFQLDQNKIEEGIIKALTRLNAVENYVLQEAGAIPQAEEPRQQTEDAPQKVTEAQEDAPPATQENAQEVTPAQDSSEPAQPQAVMPQEILPEPPVIEQPFSEQDDTPPQEEPAEDGSSDLFNIF